MTGEMVSAPVTRMRFMVPDASIPYAMAMPWIEPAQAPVSVNDGVASAPMNFATLTWSPGTATDGVNEAWMMRSRSVGRTPAISSAFLAASAPMCPAV
jgi:hypothetical protein